MQNKFDFLDSYIQRLLSDWNCPGVCVGVVVDEALVLAKGYGYRDYEQKLPITDSTLFPVASNTKLFTAVSAGMLVEEGLLEFDEPIRDKVPSIRFCNDTLNNLVTLRDLLSHRTGIPRYDGVWQGSNLSRREIVERVKVLEPITGIRQGYLYNNIMYAMVGHIIEMVCGKTWEEFVRERILAPLCMNNSVYTIADMLLQSDFVLPFHEMHETKTLQKIPYNEDKAIAPAGAIISNVHDISHWLIALLNNGKFSGKQVIPPHVLDATIKPSIVMPNFISETYGFDELIRCGYGMGRIIDVYRGHLLASHGGYIDGFHSQVSCMPKERIGVIVFVNGGHCPQLADTISLNVYEHLLGLEQTPWSERWLDVRKKDEQDQEEEKIKEGNDRISGTHPSHSIEDYAGIYTHPAYGDFNIDFRDPQQLQLDIFGTSFPLIHFHYDRFDTPDDELRGKLSLNFCTNSHGDVDSVITSIDPHEVTFTRKYEK